MTPNQPPSESPAIEVPVIPENFDMNAALQEEVTFESLQRDLDQALAKADAHWKRYLGAHAEMENIRKRSERDVQNAHKFALEKFFGALLPVCDSLMLGLAHETSDVAALREGMTLTLRQLTTAMEKFGARELDPIGAKFNPNEHEAMAMVPTDQAPPNTVFQVLQKGYVLNERLLRSAKVLVAQALPPPSA